REQNAYSYGYSYGYYDTAPIRYRLTEPQAEELIPRMCRTGRCLLRWGGGKDDLRPLRWDEGGPYEFGAEVAPDASGKHYEAAGWLRRGTERVPLSEPRLLTKGGLVFWDDHAARLLYGGAFEWIPLLRQRGPLKVPVKQGGELVRELLRQR